MSANSMLPDHIKKRFSVHLVWEWTVLLVFALLLAFPGRAPAQEKPPEEPEARVPVPKEEKKPAWEELERIIGKQRKKLEEQETLTRAQRKEIEEMRVKFEAMQRQLEEQGKLTEAQRKQIEEMNELLLSVHNRLQESRDAAPDDSITKALEKRLEALESTTREGSEIPPDTVTAGEFPGSLRIPGTDAAIKFGGRVKFSLVYNLDALGVDDQFITAEIPIRGTQEAGKGARLTMSARSSRFNVDLRTPTGVGYMRAYIEGDFAGDGNDFRLRHAYGQYRRALIGQTWSTFADPQAQTEDIDFEGLNSRNLVRQAQIRIGRELSEDVSLHIGLENPKSDITGGGSVNLFPDLITRIRWEKPWGPFGHLQGALLLRQVRAEPDARPEKTEREIGYGVTLSGKMSTPIWHADDNVVFQINGGKGIGRYINDLDSEGGQDAVIDPVTGRMEVLPVVGAYAGYQHWWREGLRSNLSYGYVYVSNDPLQAGDSYKQTNRFCLNLVWSPIQRIDVGIEGLYGTRENKDGGRGYAKQLQMAVVFWF